MKVILIKDLKGTGKAGEVVEVSDGYARNMLIPRGIAKEASAGNINTLNKQKAIKEKQLEEAIADAKETVGKLENITVEIFTKTGDGGKTFGSITSKDICEALKKQTGIEIDKKKVVTENPIKTVGLHEVTVKVYTEISAKLKVEVKAINK